MVPVRGAPHLVTQGLHLFRSQGTVHIPQAQAPSSIRSQGKHFIITGHYQGLIAKVSCNV